VTDRELHKLGEVLRTAREAKGVDLARVERDTKIRARYLTALEGGDYAELPGPVYTKGFLRNYGAYLGLDSEYLVDLYRLESAQPVTEKPSMPVPPRPIATRRRRLVVTPGTVVWALLTVGVAAFVIYFVSEFMTFARVPDLRITDPASGNVAGYQQMQYRIVGITEPNSHVTVKGLRENPSTTADETGNFAIVVALVPGSNVITLTANDPLTGRNSREVSVTIVVGSGGPSASPGGGVVVTAPADRVTLRGTVAIRGTAPPAAKLTLSAKLVDAAASSIRIESLAGDQVRIPRRNPAAPEPQTITTSDSGAFSGSLALAPGTWDLQLTLAGASEPVTRRVTVQPAAGLHGILRIRGGTSYLEIDEDGAPKKDVSGQNADSGTRVELSAREALRIRVGNAGAVRLVINGIDLGPMGDSGRVVEWRITRR
ncbi:MAG TPA: RodZ domain-containing protein, partial [Candidatus Limnocylindria bacterium]|nr:RodZ domain-containing protein [Candidatus Limnocylindria bacterium]